MIVFLARNAPGPSRAFGRLQNRPSQLPVPDMTLSCCLFHDAMPTALALQVRAGTGGEEAALFAMDLLRMYERLAGVQGWRFEVSMLTALHHWKSPGPQRCCLAALLLRQT